MCQGVVTTFYSSVICFWIGVGLAGKQVTFSYDATGQTAKIERYANGQLALTTTDSYDSYGRLTGVEQKNSGGVIASSLYKFDNLNRLTSETMLCDYLR
jgi:hypothetical protein